ncbi:A/G-specific adenine glycosylase [Candidatus Woesearchaeota archaeon]|nr:A/G-specific adenine glycosylase [Candidatus Woesearchaeota archaeon]
MKLLKWYADEGRDLPWRRTKDPYKILISEIMLQQTQVDRVIPKYETWLKTFPSWKTLAAGSRSDVLKLWSGLGYNNRAVRLHALSKLVVEELGGKLPVSEEELVKLPGIGPYTAGALMAFAHNKPGKCIDVNIERIVKRYSFPKRKKEITKKEAEEEFLFLFPKNKATDFANALMDFGSMICTASNPKCDDCPLYDDCKSRGERNEESNERVKKRQTTFLHSNRWWRGQILKALNQGLQTEKDIFAAIEGDDKKSFTAALAQLRAEGLLSGSRRISIRE